MNGQITTTEKMERNNIILIGMPTAGKSTAGVILAKILGMDFVDTDLLLQRHAGRKLKDIMEAGRLPGKDAVHKGHVSMGS